MACLQLVTPPREDDARARAPYNARCCCHGRVSGRDDAMESTVLNVQQDACHCIVKRPTEGCTSPLQIPRGHIATCNARRSRHTRNHSETGLHLLPCSVQPCPSAHSKRRVHYRKRTQSEQCPTHCILGCELSSSQPRMRCKLTAHDAMGNHDCD